MQTDMTLIYAYRVYANPPRTQNDFSYVSLWLQNWIPFFETERKAFFLTIMSLSEVI